MLVFPLGVHVLLEGTLLCDRIYNDCRKTQKFSFSQVHNFFVRVSPAWLEGNLFQSCWGSGCTNCQNPRWFSGLPALTQYHLLLLRLWSQIQCNHAPSHSSWWTCKWETTNEANMDENSLKEIWIFKLHDNWVNFNCWGKPPEQRLFVNYCFQSLKCTFNLNNHIMFQSNALNSASATETILLLYFPTTFCLPTLLKRLLCPALPYFSQMGSLLRITGFPTTINRDLALVTATLNLCRVDRYVKEEKQREIHGRFKDKHIKDLAGFIITSYGEEGIKTDLFIWQESNIEVFVHPDIVDAAADSGDHDDLPLLSLKLLHRPHLIQRNGFSAKIQKEISNNIVVNEHTPYLLNDARARKETEEQNLLVSPYWFCAEETLNEHPCISFRAPNKMSRYRFVHLQQRH